MARSELTSRELKKRIFELLASSDLNGSIQRLLELPARQAINPLFSFIVSPDPAIHWPAVTAMGAVVACLADRDMESSRVIMRRFMWQLNDESGGIGWGCPESMGEATARHEGLAGEFAPVLISYIRKDGNFLEYEPLQPGALWGIGRLAQARPLLAQEALTPLMSFLNSSAAAVRGLAVWALGFLGRVEAMPRLERLLEDGTQIDIYLHQKLQVRRIADLARQALAAIRERV
jgi:hypothetical protein